MEIKRIKMSIWPVACLLGLLSLLLSTSAQAQTDTRCFPETGFCISGVIRTYWERNGGLAVFGYPISTEIANENVEGTFVGQTQWFQRDRLEVHVDGVKAGRLGARILELQGRSWEQFERASAVPPSCQWFRETGHSLCEPFLSYWRRNGGLERFGFPLTEPFTETVGDWRGTVQFFERRRMEHHVENRGTAYEVLLGLLGNETSQIAPPVLCTTQSTEAIQSALETAPEVRERLGCPTQSWVSVPAIRQRFERGVMFWVDLDTQGKWIYRFYRSQYAPGNPLTGWADPDTWDESQRADLGYSAPDGLYAPVRGFGKVWANKYVRQDLGWATEPEQSARATVQRYTSEAVVLTLDNQTFYYLGKNARFAGIIQH